MKTFLFLLPLLMVLCACSHQIEAGLSEQDAHEIVVTLRESGIDAAAEPEPGPVGKEGALWQVKIRGGGEQIVAAWKVLREHGLPHEKVQGLEAVLKNSGIIPTAMEDKARMTVGLEGDLTRTLRSVPGVVDARVHVVLPANNTMSLDPKDQSSTTAAVLVRYRGERSPLTDDEIRGLVAKGVEGLITTNVAVVQKPATELPLPPQTKVGPLNDAQWTVAGALALSGLSSVGALSMLVVSKRRALRIKTLERQLAQLRGGSNLRLSGDAKA
jgi:type III secretion protein J